VFTPKLSFDTPLPVVIYIAGETLNGGESHELQPSAELAKQRDCVFVSISIRRSVLGFLSLNVLSHRFVIDPSSKKKTFYEK
jgi:carboxylesterase type B